MASRVGSESVVHRCGHEEPSGPADEAIGAVGPHDEGAIELMQDVVDEVEERSLHPSDIGGTPHVLNYPGYSAWCLGEAGRYR
jgi:hypothetical protein